MFTVKGHNPKGRRKIIAKVPTMQRAYRLTTGSGGEPFHERPK